MEQHLQETYGIMVYQEQVMRLAADLAGFSLGEADTLRKAMGKKDRELMATAAREVHLGLQGQQDRRDARPSASGTSSRSSRATASTRATPRATGVVAYQTAYLKANYPVEFMAALLTSEMEKTDKIVQYVEECRAMGLRVEPPDVNVSAAPTSRVAGEAIHFGLAAIKNVGATAIESIVQDARGGRRASPSLDDFCARVDLRLVNRRVVECLIKAGAFDSLRQHAGGPPRRARPGDGGRPAPAARPRGRAGLALRRARAAATPAGRGAVAAAARVPEWPQEEMLALEKEVLGFYLSGHPLEQYREVARAARRRSARPTWPRARPARACSCWAR